MKDGRKKEESTNGDSPDELGVSASREDFLANCDTTVPHTLG